MTLLFLQRVAPFTWSKEPTIATQTLNFIAAAATPIHCEGCEQRIVRALRVIRGVNGVEASAATQRIHVVFDPEQTSAKQVEAKLELAGFTVQREGGPA